MKTAGLIILNLTVLSLLVLGIPVPGRADSPHPCDSSYNTHLTNFTGGTSATIYIARDSCGLGSTATGWRVRLYSAGTNPPTGTLLCSWPDNQGTFQNVDPNANPTNTATFTTSDGSLNCQPLPHGSTARIKIQIDYLVPGPTQMSHSHIVTNSP